MASNSISGYLEWITPARGDPTHSLLRAHLLFEQLLDAFLQRALPHASALSDARFTFAQKLALARAAAPSVSPSHWTWQAVARLNKIRNTLAHSPGPKLTADLRDYVAYCVKHSKQPLPNAELKLSDREADRSSPKGAHYTAADMVTIGLYISLAGYLGFDIASFTDLSDRAA